MFLVPRPPSRVIIERMDARKLRLYSAIQRLATVEAVVSDEAVAADAERDELLKVAATLASERERLKRLLESGQGEPHLATVKLLAIQLGIGKSHANAKLMEAVRQGRLSPAESKEGYGKEFILEDAAAAMLEMGVKPKRQDWSDGARLPARRKS